MIVRACCNNCGFVGSHDVPYRAKIRGTKIEDREVVGESAFTTEADDERPFLCTNCGRAELEVIYWDGTKLKPGFIGDKVERLVDG